MHEESYPKSTSTWAGMIAEDMRITVYCAPCSRSVELDLTQFPPEGRATGRVFKCSECGQKGQCIVSPRSNDRNVAHGIPNDFIGPFPKLVIRPKRRRRR